MLDRQFWQTLTEAQSTTPADTDRPVVGFAVQSVNGNRGLVSINISLVYHMQFFESVYKRIQSLNPNSTAFTPEPKPEFELLDESVFSHQRDSKKELNRPGAVEVQKGKVRK